MKQSLTSEINSLYHSWLTSTDPSVSQRSLSQFLKKLEKYTKGYLRAQYKDLLPFFDDIFSEMLEKIHNAHMKQEIDTLDYFCSWYRVAIKNHSKYYHKYLNRDKRINILNEYQMGKTIIDIEFNVCIQNFYTDQQQQEVAEIINSILALEPDKSLFIDRHVYGISENELAVDYDTTVDGVKGRLKRAKKRLYISYMKHKYN